MAVGGKTDAAMKDEFNLLIILCYNGGACVRMFCAISVLSVHMWCVRNCVHIVRVSTLNSVPCVHMSDMVSPTPRH